MADLWQCEVCGRHFSNIDNRIQLDRKIDFGHKSFEYAPYLNLCTDCERWIKRGGLDR